MCAKGQGDLVGKTFQNCLNMTDCKITQNTSRDVGPQAKMVALFSQETMLRNRISHNSSGWGPFPMALVRL